MDEATKLPAAKRRLHIAASGRQYEEKEERGKQ